MRIEDHIAALRADGELFAGLLERAEEEGRLDAKVPSCPEWTVRELALHLGGVHRWAASHVRDARAGMIPPEQEEQLFGPMPDDRALVEWFGDGQRQLVDVLASAPADLVCWTFLPAPSPVAFWARRQAHETAIHRVDAQLALDSVPAVRAEFAVDGLDELLLGFFSRRSNRLRSEEPRTLRVVATDADASWLVRIGPEGAQAQRLNNAQPQAEPIRYNESAEHGGTAEHGPGLYDATLAGPASALYLGLWNRGRLPGSRETVAGLAVTGDGRVIDLWRTKATVTWT
jgi:uncharacterized protein (TIGR03083 family)